VVQAEAEVVGEAGERPVPGVPRGAAELQAGVVRRAALLRVAAAVLALKEKSVLQFAVKGPILKSLPASRR
jgi:hypothetical protein